MAEHFCKEHHTPWFMTGKMKGFAHPILDENGEKTGKWCNEPKSEAQETESKPNAKPAYGQDSPEKRRSIERQKSLECAIEWGKALLEGKTPFAFEILDIAEMYYQWISQGTIPHTVPSSTSGTSQTASPKTPTPTSPPAREEKVPEITPETVYANIKTLLAKKIWAGADLKKAFDGVGALGDKTSEKLKSLSMENLLVVSARVNKALNPLVEKAKKLGEEIDKQDIPF